MTPESTNVKEDDFATENNNVHENKPLAPGLLPIPPMIQKSLEAFRRDLPELMKTHYRQWVVYHGDKRLGFGKSQTKLIKEYLAKGIPRDQFVVCSVEPEIPDEDEVEIFPR